jgi:hypothetical protein
MEIRAKVRAEKIRSLTLASWKNTSGKSWLWNCRAKVGWNRKTSIGRNLPGDWGYDPARWFEDGVGKVWVHFVTSGGRLVYESLMMDGPWFGWSSLDYGHVVVPLDVPRNTFISYVKECKAQIAKMLFLIVSSLKIYSNCLSTAVFVFHIDLIADDHAESVFRISSSMQETVDIFSVWWLRCWIWCGVWTFNLCWNISYVW